MDAVASLDHQVGNRRVYSQVDGFVGLAVDIAEVAVGFREHP